MRAYKKYILAVVLGLSAVILSCSLDDDNGISVNKEFEIALKVQYPAAGKIKWEQRSIYKVAAFELYGTKMWAWYDSECKWYMTEQQTPFSKLPAKVTEAFNRDNTLRYTGIYNTTSIDRPVIEPIYVIGIESVDFKTGKFYSKDGILIKTENASYELYGDYRYEIAPDVPSEVWEFIYAKHLNPRIMEIDILFPGIIYATIIDDGFIKKAAFSLPYGTWSHTRWEVSKDYVTGNHPEINDLFRELGYEENYEVVAIEFMETGMAEYYVYTLMRNGEQETISIPLYEIYPQQEQSDSFAAAI